MERKYDEISIRNARKEDAKQLCKWWNDGTVMAHAGFPNGLSTTIEEVASQIEKESDETTRRHIIFWKEIAIGEMNSTGLRGDCYDLTGFILSGERAKHRRIFGITL